jgi:hypothetical protein
MWHTSLMRSVSSLNHRLLVCSASWIFRPSCECFELIRAPCFAMVCAARARFRDTFSAARCSFVLLAFWTSCEAFPAPNDAERFTAMLIRFALRSKLVT